MTKLSVVVVPLEGPKKLNRCLAALALQRDIADLEIIVPYNEALEKFTLLESKFSNVFFVQLSGHHTYASLRGHGVRISSGEIVAITEDHCIPREDWAHEIVSAHDSPHAAIGGAVEKKRPDSKLNWALYLVDYLRYSTPTEGPCRNLTDCNVSYKRAALEKISDVWTEEFHEPDVNGALSARGMSLWITPNIVLDQQRSIDLQEAFRDRYRFGRLFGAGRAINVSFRRRLLHLIFAPLLPALLTIRTMRDAHKRPAYTGPFWRSFGLVLLLNTVWAWGEFVGSLTMSTDMTLSYKSQVNSSNP